MVHAFLNSSEDPESIVNETFVNYTINSSGKNASISLTLPPGGTSDFYQLSLKMYNSTGKIDEIVFGGSETHVNDTDPDFLHVGYLWPFVPDTTLPSITDISADPETVGFGFNVILKQSLFKNSGVFCKQAEQQPH